MKIALKYTITFLILLILNCTSPGVKKINLKKYFDKPPLSFTQIEFEMTPNKEDYPHSDAVFLLREAKYKAERIFTFTEHVVIKIFNDAGKRYANVRIPYWADYSDIIYLEARTIKPDGEIIYLDKKDIFEVSDFPDFLLYADRKAKVFTFPGVDTNCILEYVYTVGLLYPFVPMWYFQAEDPTVYAKFSYEVPMNLGFKYIYTNLPGKEIKKEISDYPGWNRGTLWVRDLPELKKEPFLPPLTEISSWILMTWSNMKLLFQEITSREESWALIGQDYKNIIDKILKPDKAIVEKAKELTKGCKSDEEKIISIVKFIQKKFRYVAVAIEGHRTLPHPPGKVLKNLYGDCKDLSGLLISLLKAIDIDAYAVLVRVKSDGKLIEDFPSRNQINHVIVAIPLKYFDDDIKYTKATVFGENDFSKNDDFVIFDPAATSYPLGKIHADIEGTKAVICLGENSRLINLPEIHYRDNISINKILLNPSDSVSRETSGMISMQIRGEDACRLRWILNNYSQMEIHNYLNDYLNRMQVRMEMDTFEIRNKEETDSVLRMDFKFKLRGLQSVKGKIVIPVIFIPLKYFDKLHNLDRRNHHIYFEFPYYQNDVCKIIVNKQHQLSSLPEKEYFSNEWFDYSLSAYSSGDTIIVNRIVGVKSKVVPKDRFEELKEIIEKISLSNNKLVILAQKK
ncbi:MAG: DUF3857 domain-containing protein [candidate division WOR-3 bacterium]|nr:DUF3857 domain-containing protein [candidate division WOR-3 bacterium]